MRLRTRAILLEDRAKRTAMRAAARLGSKKHVGMLEGPSRDMTDFIHTPAFRSLFDREKEAVKRWMAKGRGMSYLDVGAGEGRMTRLALESGASQVTAIDILDSCLEVLRGIPGVEVRKMNARKLEFSDSSFDRVMLLGNTLAGMHEEYPGGERSFQAEVLKEMLRVARYEVCVTLHAPETLRTMLEVYRLNNWRFYGYDDTTGIKRMVYTTKDMEGIEFRSQHFTEEVIRQLMAEAGIQDYEIVHIDGIQRMVLIRKTLG